MDKGWITSLLILFWTKTIRCNKSLNERDCKVLTFSPTIKGNRTCYLQLQLKIFFASFCRANIKKQAGETRPAVCTRSCPRLGTLCTLKRLHSCRVRCVHTQHPIPYSPQLEGMKGVSWVFLLLCRTSLP